MRTDEARGIIRIKKLIDDGLLILGSESWSYELIPTGIRALDDLLGGGLPKGHITEIYGLPGCGKTTVGYHTLAANKDSLKLRTVGFMNGKKAMPIRAGVIDTEGTFDKDRAGALGFPVSELGIMRPDYGEQGLAAAEAFAAAKIGLVLIDSLRGLVPLKII